MQTLPCSSTGLDWIKQELLGLKSEANIKVEKLQFF